MRMDTEQTTDQIPVGAKVQLKPGCDEVYVRAWVGSMGWVKDSKMDDEYGLYAKVWIQWDQEDWHYNGEPDGWTYASHFEVVEPPPTLEDIAQTAQERVDEEHTCSECGQPIEDEDELIQAQFIDEVSQGFDEASGGEAFMLIIATRDPDGELQPEIISASMSEESSRMIRMAVMHMARLGMIGGPLDPRGDHEE